MGTPGLARRKLGLMAQTSSLHRRSKWRWLPSLTPNSIAFGTASFSSSVLCTLFSLYVTPVFTSIHQASKKFTSDPQVRSWTVESIKLYRNVTAPAETVFTIGDTRSCPGTLKGGHPDQGVNPGRMCPSFLDHDKLIMLAAATTAFLLSGVNCRRFEYVRRPYTLMSHL